LNADFHSRSPNNTLRDNDPNGTLFNYYRGTLFNYYLHRYTDEGNRRWLTKEELDKVMQTPMKRERDNMTRNFFIFSVFTGVGQK
jgi:hypothetical protein